MYNAPQFESRFVLFYSWLNLSHASLEAISQNCVLLVVSYRWQMILMWLLTGDHLSKLVSASILQCKVAHFAFIIKKYFEERYFEPVNFSLVIKLSIICWFMCLYIRIFPWILILFIGLWSLLSYILGCSNCPNFG